ncbi:MAG: hypothetical protein DMF62_07550 [Acidobacteria bacterium]|nr:MAG: hypothetical protein DMF62_07550 [Acidobacteriota bacterium]
MNRFSYITSTNDEKATGVVNADYIAQKIANRTVSMITMNDDDTMFGFSLTDGSRIKFRLRPHAAEVVYFAPSSK